MITFKNIEDRDQQFIEKVYRSTRENELSLTNWSEEQKYHFILIQLMAQLSHYKNSFKDATYQIILYKNQPAGRLYLWESETEIRVIDISLLPRFQGKGIGTKILKDIIKSSEAKNKMVTLHIIPGNPARKLYDKLGFIHIRDTGIHQYMERKPRY